jgi:solute carrier family 35 protein F1/2
MDSYGTAKTSAIETQINPIDPVAGSYLKSTDGEASGSAANGPAGVYEMRAPEDGIDRADLAHAIDEIESKKKSWYAYMLTRDFWIVLALGQVLALCITGTNTFSSLLADVGTSVPAFQTFFNYCLLLLVFSSYTVYKYGFKKYFRLLLVDGWKYIILSFLDVEGNYFTVLAYDYTTILSAQLLNFWSIVMVVIVSFTLLKVRYKIPQIIGILVACGGMGLLLGSDHITGGDAGAPPNQLKGDLFGLLGATFYGLSNVFEEWFVSKRPAYEVLGMLGLFGVLINGTQAAIFDRQSFMDATWNGQVIGWIVGYTIILFIFYALAPLILRMASAAFFDISLLTGNFWGTIIGIHVFGETIYYLYPIAFVLILVGLIIYFLAGSMLGDSKKPWLGADQDAGIAGLGTAKQKAVNLAERERVAAAEGHLA